MKKRIISMLLTVLMLAGLFPVSAFAVEAEVPAEQQATAEAHVHEYVFVEEVPAEVGRDGVKAHYACTDCDKLFILEEDEYVEVQPEDLVIPALQEETEPKEPSEAPVITVNEPAAGDDSALNLENTEGKPEAKPEDPAMATATLSNELLTEASGTCGTNLTWTLTDAGLLTISGTGAMTDYDDCYPQAPWYNYGSNITNVVIGNGVASIGSYSFYGCSRLTSVTIPEGVTSIGDCAFRSCSRLTSVTIPEGVTSIGDYAFSSCSSLTSVTIPEGVTSIGDHAFFYCSSLTSVTILEGVTSLGSYSFCGCSSLTSVTIPEGVTSIGEFCVLFLQQPGKSGNNGYRGMVRNRVCY